MVTDLGDAKLKRELLQKLTTTTFGATVGVRSDGSQPHRGKGRAPAPDAWPNLASIVMGWSMSDMLSSLKFKTKVEPPPQQLAAICLQAVYMMKHLSEVPTSAPAIGYASTALVLSRRVQRLMGVEMA